MTDKIIADDGGIYQILFIYAWYIADNQPMHYWKFTHMQNMYGYRFFLN